jgi:NAD(P)-dependent dehydrogenase (short-subunit alcohol dehydrogenase family)
VKLLDINPQQWAEVLSVNLTGVFSCVHAEIAQMVKQETGGSIVNTASICGLVALPQATAYNSAKHGVIGLTKSAAVEYGPKNIRVNAVCPGFIDTPMLAEGAGANQDVLDGVVNQLPIRRIAGPNEVADVIAWLFSSQSSYVTGVAMPIDGGWTAQ